MSGKIRAKAPILLLVLAAVWLNQPTEASAQIETPYDLINAVNELRALHGLDPYEIDPWLMAYAQEHSEYQAATHVGTHRHSDGTTPLSMGLQENVAGGTVGVVTAAVVVYEIWVDWGHRHILTGYATGQIGAGVALSDDGFVYYTVDIRPGEELSATTAPFVPLGTSTPNQDGSVVHVVGYGQTLWGIAMSYGVTVDDVRRLNNIAADSTVIRAGQQLLIRAAAPTTLVPSDATPSSLAQSSSMTIAPITSTAFSTEPVMPSQWATAQPTGTPSDVSQNRNGTGMIIALAIGIIGLAVATIVGFWQAHKDRTADAQK